MSDHLTDKGSLITSDLLSDNEHIKLRMNEQMRYGHSDPTFFKMPRKLNKILTDENGDNYEALCGMYSSHNRYCYDRINVKGLAPYDYRKYLDSQK